ncbi:MAG: tRNA guanosine(15) transglycosylase TgtA [Candidatus Nezhaarchaeales archaeon]|nr:MAG: tRNA guanosine(15) transglycosylase TgtA [Candidatus Nezhaarchaeota archaeon WYZ-LMO8]TDA36731.1 MAG: tRNA guanosine(15) transglycosylase TgtA [Candidatus Nezhaarchaeota archaeon WYZ-LMO7]
MTFEVLDKDLAGRIGKLRTRRGIIETPYLFPVINPFDTTITVGDIEKLGFNAFITNILHVRRAMQEYGVTDVHELLSFPGPIMTDSGAYQLLVYGHVDITPDEVIVLQEKCGSDIAVILDFPTGETPYSEASYRVNETLKRAKALWSIRTDETILWVGPVQGAPYIDLVKYCAEELSTLNFDIYAIGSPTTIMESYNYEVLVDIIFAAKKTLPLGKPVHLFGAGHPMMLSLAVALGCDLFDSASYILYAKESRYMAHDGTYKLQDLEYFPCSCPVCSRYTPQEVSEMADGKVKLLALHNLYMLGSEIRRIKQAIKEGTLWGYVSLRLRSHPRLFSVFSKFKKYSFFLERLDPVTKPSISGLFFYGYHDSFNPKVVRHFKKLKNCLHHLRWNVLVLLPRKDEALSSSFIKKLMEKIRNEIRGFENIKFLFYDFPFCLIPLELEGVYPLSQYEVPSKIDMLTKRYVSIKISELLSILRPRSIVLYNDLKRWGKHIEAACRKSCDNIKVLHTKEPYELRDLEVLLLLLKEIAGQ